MGTSVTRLEARRRRPWPRYRVAYWGEMTQCWREEPRVYTEYKAALARASALAARGDRVRVCVMHQSGMKQEMTLEEFEGLKSHGQTQG